MSLKNTSLLIQSSPLPATFKGSPDDLRAEIVRRLKIVSPNGVNFIYIGDTQPTSNVGPWLKGGTQWWVWDDTTNTYIPLDVSASVTIPFWTGTSTPASSVPPVWLQTDTDPTDQNPSIGNPQAWYVWNGSSWVPFVGVVLSGPSASRPSAPVNYQQYYDTDISCLIWWERGEWRTVTGCPGDVKAVTFPTLTQALQFNPGWTVLGAGQQSLRGRIVMQAAKDQGSSPQTILTVDPGVPQHAAFDTFGETDGVQINESSPVPYPPQLALWHLVKT